MSGQHSPYAKFSLPSQKVVLWAMLYMRTALILLFILCFIFALFKIPLEINSPIFVQIAICLFLLNIANWYGQKRRIEPELLVYISLVVDTLLLSELIYFTGGSTNPITVLYVWPVICAALFCKPYRAWFLTFIIILIYLALFVFYQPMKIFNLHSQHSILIHLFGMWIAFSLSAVLMMGLISTLVQIVRRHELRLSQAYRRQQEDEYWLVLGMDAASVAHELSTPMNNMMLITDELLSNSRLPDGAREDMALLDAQLQQCQESLARLKTSNNHMARNVNLYDELKNRIKRWQNLRPDIRCQWQRNPGDKTDYFVTLDESFWHAFFNILNNAADASDQSIDLFTQMGANYNWQITIRNQHGFLTKDQLTKAGLDMLDSNKPFGMGLGVHLAYATLSRLGGSLHLNNHPTGGVEARIVLPLSPAEPTES